LPPTHTHTYIYIYIYIYIHVMETSYYNYKYNTIKNKQNIFIKYIIQQNINNFNNYLSYQLLNFI